MTVHQLNRDQLISLKQKYLCEQDDAGNIEGGLYMSDLADADNIVSDETIIAAYEGTEFVEEDF